MSTSRWLPVWCGPWVVLLAAAAHLADPSPAAAHCGCCGKPGGDEQLLLMQLGVTPDQAQKLLPIFEKAMARRAQHYLEIAELTPKMLETYTKFRNEDARDQGFSKEVEGETARLHGQEVRLGDQFGRDILELEKQVEAILTERQLKLLGEATCAAPAASADAMVGHIAGGNMTAVGAALDPQVADTLTKMEEIDQFRHPRPTQLGRQLLEPKIFDQLYFLAHAKPPEKAVDAALTARNGTRKLPRQQHDELNKQLGPIRAEINAWNLVNGLHLSKEQAVTIARCAQEAKLVRQQFREGPLGPRARAEAKRSAQMAIAPAVVENLYQLERRVVDTLSDTQVQVIRDFKPCLLPPQNLKDPVRVGQANDNTALTRFLEGARRLPADRRERAVEGWLAGEEKQFGKYDDDYREHRRKVMLATLTEAAAMNDTDFAAAGNTLAGRAQPVDMRTELRYKLDGIFTDRHLPGVIARTMLFDDSMVYVLTVRAEQLSRPIKVVKRDLSKSPRAEHTDKSTQIGNDGTRE